MLSSLICIHTYSYGSSTMLLVITLFDWLVQINGVAWQLTSFLPITKLEFKNNCKHEICVVLANKYLQYAISYLFQKRGEFLFMIAVSLGPKRIIYNMDGDRKRDEIFYLGWFFENRTFNWAIIEADVNDEIRFVFIYCQWTICLDRFLVFAGEIIC